MLASLLAIRDLLGGIPYLVYFIQGRARTQSPTNINYASESPTFGAIAQVNPPGVQWTGLAVGEPPTGSRYPLCQVSMLGLGLFGILNKYLVQIDTSQNLHTAVLICELGQLLLAASARHAPSDCFA